MQCNFPNTRTRKDGSEYTHRCGQCISCRVTKSQEWAFRLLLEAQQTEGLCLFVTLTYTEKHLPRTENGLQTVRVQHLRQFIRDLRRNTGWQIRYFAPTEYGKQGRAHGHCALFINNPTMPAPWEPKGENRRHLEENKIRWRQYSVVEREILRAWGCKGSIQAAEFNQARAAYLAKYLAKQATRPESLHPEQEPEQFTMSPGLGRDAAKLLADEITAVGGTTLELKKPGILLDVSTWSIDLQDRAIGLRQAHHTDKKTYPVPQYIRQRIINHLGGDQRSDKEKVAELQFRNHLRRLEAFTKREGVNEKFERKARRKLAEGGEL